MVAIAPTRLPIVQRRESPAGSDYLTHARQRASRIAPAAPIGSAARPYPSAKPRSYTAAKRAQPNPPGPTISPAPTRTERQKPRTAPVEPLAVSLKDEFDRVKRHQTTTERRRRIHLPRSRRGKIVLFAPLILLLVAGGVLGQTIFNATRAYHNIFVAQAPHAETGKFVVQESGNGTKVIVQAAPTEQAAAAAIPEWDGKDRITMLLLGVDRRTTEASRSDTMILVNIDPVTKTASMMSIPRDLKVIVPGYGVQKINAAYAFGDADNVPGGGPGLAIRTIEANFGIRISYYAQVDFNGFMKLIDTVGGLTLDVPYPIKDDTYPGPGNQYMRVYFKPGWQHMNGAQALEYARTRHDDGDDRRSARQQQVLLALRQQAVSLSLLTKAPELLTELGDAVRTDMPLTKALQLAKLGSEIDPASIKQVTLNDALTVSEEDGQPYFLIADWSKIGDIMTGFMGTKITPPMSALANPDYGVQIVVNDGTLNPGLGGRVAAVLKQNGFTNVTVVDEPDAGAYPTSSVSARSQDLSTAYLVASLVGVSVDSIGVDDAAVAQPITAVAASPVASESASPISQNSVAFLPTPTPGAGGSSPAASTGRIMIVLGDDAKDPAFFTNAPYDQETSDGPIATSPAIENTDGGG
jgi:polyisoprenyl-teichoic acid--peptidoglycan teichoic acid transferase